MQWKWMWTMALLVMLVLGGCMTGCSAKYWTGRIEPVTQVSTGLFGVEFKDTKENDIRIAGLEVDPTTKYLKADEILVANHSAVVIAADSERMAKVTECMKVQVEYQRQLGMNLAMALAAGGDAASKFLGSLPSIDLGFQSPVLSGTGSLRAANPASRPAAESPPPATESPPPATEGPQSAAPDDVDDADGS
jgi:hypothetical protein